MTRFVAWVRSLWPFGGPMFIPERRRSRRYVTLRNTARAAIMLVVAYVLLSLWAAFRPAHSGSSLWQESPASSTSPPVPREPFPVVREGSSGDYPPAGPIQILNESPAVPPAPRPPPPQKTSAPQEPQPRLGNGQRIVISGGSEGVRVHVETATAPAGTPP